jgi:hypothetical protein
MSNTNTNFVIFAGQGYYPCGGYYDLYASANTLAEALIILHEAVTIGSKPQKYYGWDAQPITENYDYYKKPRDWAHIVNLQTHKIVVSKSAFIGSKYDSYDLDK